MTKKGSTLMGIHTYDILANPFYVDQFEYISPVIANRKVVINDGDDDESNDLYQQNVIKMALSIAYYNQQEAERLINSVFQRPIQNKI